MNGVPFSMEKKGRSEKDHQIIASVILPVLSSLFSLYNEYGQSRTFTIKALIIKILAIIELFKAILQSIIPTVLHEV